MKSKWQVLIVWIIAILSTGMIFFVSFASGFHRNPGLYIPIVLVYIVFGGLLAIRNPKNVIGWIFLASIFLLITNEAMVWYANLGLLVNPGSLPGAMVIAAVAGFFEYLGYGLLFIFPFLLFPDGKLISRRWIPVIWLAGFTLVLLSFEIFRPGPLMSFPDVENPLGIFQLSGYFEISGTIISILAVFLFIIGPLSLLLRYRQAPSIQRQQIKWFAYTGILVLVWLLFLVFFSTSIPDLVAIVMESLVLASLPVAITIAILRYRLWDIDLIIRKTLQYALLTGVLALVYFGSVVLLQGLVENLTGEQSPVVIVISTLLIAALFNPMRSRIQDLIDRRFYRNKYDAERALSEFADAARDEVDINKLEIALMQVVEETMQPKKIMLWLQTGKDKNVS